MLKGLSKDDGFAAAAASNWLEMLARWLDSDVSGGSVCHFEAVAQALGHGVLGQPSSAR